MFSFLQITKKFKLIINTDQDWYFLSILILALATAISWITFAQLSMRPIEKSMKNDGVLNGFDKGGIGGRIFDYAFAIALPEKLALRLNSLMDVKLIRAYASEADRLRGVIFLTITYSWIATVSIGFILGYADYTPQHN